MPVFRQNVALFVSAIAIATITTIGSGVFFQVIKDITAPATGDLLFYFHGSGSLASLHRGIRGDTNGNLVMS